MKSVFVKELNRSIKLKKKLSKIEPKVNKAINLMYNTLKSGNKVLLCGNGGSAADAQHLAAEYLISLRPTVNRRSMPVISLAQDVSTVTACGNDLGFENLFKRTFEGLANQNDLLIAFSTSGNSKNIIKVLKSAKQRKINSISLLGCKGGKSKGLSNLDIIVPEKITARIQECHIFLGHFIFEQVENKMIKNKFNF